jgi:splicing factor 1
MAWRNQGITGSNNIPLGNRRRGFGGDNDDGGYNPSAPAEGLSELKRGRSPTRGKSSLASPLLSFTNDGIAESSDGPRQRKKRNRWGDASENKAAGLMGLPTAIYSAMTTEQLDAYTLHLRIEEITQKLKINDVVPADGDRYVSSPPTWSQLILTFAGLPRLRRSTITLVAVSTLASSDTASVLKTSATSL